MADFQKYGLKFKLALHFILPHVLLAQLSVSLPTFSIIIRDLTKGKKIKEDRWDMDVCSNQLFTMIG